MRRFEIWCELEPRITRADLVAGRSDYLVWSWHPTWRDAERWSREVDLRDEVKSCRSKVVEVLFGHTLPGPLIFTDDPQPKARRRRRRRAGRTEADGGDDHDSALA